MGFRLSYKRNILAISINQLNMSLKQALLSNYYKSKNSKSSDSDNDSGGESIYLPSKSKSLYDQPMSWTRVKNI